MLKSHPCSGGTQIGVHSARTHTYAQTHIQAIQATDHTTPPVSRALALFSAPCQFLCDHTVRHTQHALCVTRAKPHISYVESHLHQVDCFTELPLFPTVIYLMHPAVILF